MEPKYPSRKPLSLKTGSGKTRSALSLATQELAEIISHGNRQWTKGAALLTSVADADVRKAGYRDMQQWIASLCLNSGVRSGEVWRWLRAGEFYHLLQREHGEWPPVTESMLGLVTLENLARLKRFAPERVFEETLAAVTAGKISQAELRKLAKLYSSELAPKSDSASHSTDIERYRLFTAESVDLLRQHVFSLKLLQQGRPIALGEILVGSITLPVVSDAVMLAYDLDGDASLHIFKMLVAANDAGSNRTIVKSASQWKRYFDYSWVVTATKPADEVQFELRQLGVGVLLVANDSLDVYLPAQRSVATRRQDALVRLSHDRLAGKMTWQMSSHGLSVKIPRKKNSVRF